MNLYIFAEFPFALRAERNMLFKNVRRCDLRVENNRLVELLPLDGSPVRAFVPDERFFSLSSPDVVKVLMKNGAALQFEKSANPVGFAVLDQKKLQDALLTAFSDGCYKFSVEIPGNYRILSLKEKIDAIGEFYLSSHRFFYAYTEKKRLICLSGEDLRTVFDKPAESYFFDGDFVTETVLGGTPRLIRTEWEYEGDSFRPRRAETTPSVVKHPLCDEILPYAFAEAVLAGDDLAPFLAPDLLPNARFLRDYLGNYSGVFPPPRRENDILPALLYPVKENIYRTKSLKCEILNGKIVNLTLI